MIHTISEICWLFAMRLASPGLAFVLAELATESVVLSPSLTLASGVMGKTQRLLLSAVPWSSGIEDSPASSISEIMVALVAGLALRTRPRDPDFELLPLLLRLEVLESLDKLRGLGGVTRPPLTSPFAKSGDIAKGATALVNERNECTSWMSTSSTFNFASNSSRARLRRSRSSFHSSRKDDH